MNPFLKSVARGVLNAFIVIGLFIWVITLVGLPSVFVLSAIGQEVGATMIRVFGYLFLAPILVWLLFKTRARFLDRKNSESPTKIFPLILKIIVGLTGALFVLQLVGIVYQISDLGYANNLSVIGALILIVVLVGSLLLLRRKTK